MKRLMTLTAAIAGIALAPSAHAGTLIFADGLGDATPTSTVEPLVPPRYQVDTIERVDYPAEIWPVSGLFSHTAGQSMAIGVTRLDDLISSAPGPVIVVGGSLGAMVVDQELRNLETQTNPPSPSDILFVEFGNPGGAGGVLSYVPYGAYIPVLDIVAQPTPETRYTVVVVTNQYDGLANFPDRPWNLFAVANAMVGAIVYHNVPAYADAVQKAENGQVPEEYVTTTVNEEGGVTTTYLVPRPLALTAPLAEVAPTAANNLNAVLTPIVNRGYSNLTPDAGPYIAPGGKLVTGESIVELSPTRAVRPSTAPKRAAGAQVVPTTKRHAAVSLTTSLTKKVRSGVLTTSSGKRFGSGPLSRRLNMTTPDSALRTGPRSK